MATKSCSHGVYVDYFSYTPTKDTLVSLSAYLETGALCNINGNVMLQLYSADITKSFVNVVDNLNPYVANFGGLTLNIHHKFIAKAGVEYKIRVTQANVNSQSFNLTIDTYSNVTWDVL